VGSSELQRPIKNLKNFKVQGLSTITVLLLNLPKAFEDSERLSSFPVGGHISRICTEPLLKTADRHLPALETVRGKAGLCVTTRKEVL
jgi:hypothetical protein